MPNRTDRRGRGIPPARVVIGTTEGKALRRLLNERHGYSPEEAVAALIGGELSTALLPDEHRYALARWVAAGLPSEGLEEIREILTDVLKQVTRFSD